MLKLMGMKNLQFYAKNFCLSKPVYLVRYISLLHVFSASEDNLLTSFKTGRRSKLSVPKPDGGDISLWNLLFRNIGKDLTKISMPVTLNQPLSMLQVSKHVTGSRYILIHLAGFYSDIIECLHIDRGTWILYSWLGQVEIFSLYHIHLSVGHVVQNSHKKLNVCPSVCSRLVLYNY